MKNGILFLMLLCLCSCNNTADKNGGKDIGVTEPQADTVIKKYADTSYVDRNGKNYKFLGQIPDSLRTPEQVKLLTLLSDVSYRYISVKDNHEVYNLTREQFVAKGLPERFYDLLLTSIKENNHLIDVDSVKNIDSMVRDQRKKLGIVEN